MSLFKLINYQIVVFDDVYILFHFNIILKHNLMSCIKRKYFACLVTVQPLQALQL